MSVCKYRLVAHDLTQTKVAKLHIILGVNKNISRLEISMQNLSLFPLMAFK